MQEQTRSNVAAADHVRFSGNFHERRPAQNCNARQHSLKLKCATRLKTPDDLTSGIKKYLKTDNCGMEIAL